MQFRSLGEGLLERWYDYRTTDWANYLEYPEFTLKQTQQLLAITA